ncbi:MAG: BatA domain-containing protein [Opitutales bacterium]
MNFLQPGILWAMAPFLLAPIVIHLLSRRLSRKLEFSTVRHLKVSLTRSASIYRWRHWLFMLLRTLLLLLILLALKRSHLIINESYES